MPATDQRETIQAALRDKSFGKWVWKPLHNRSFFEPKESSRSRAVAFFHEVTHLIERTDDNVAELPGRGHHEEGRTYELLFGADRAREIIERNNGNRINRDLRTCELIYRRDGRALGATDP